MKLRESCSFQWQFLNCSVCLTRQYHSYGYPLISSTFHFGEMLQYNSVSCCQRARIGPCISSAETHMFFFFSSKKYYRGEVFQSLLGCGRWKLSWSLSEVSFQNIWWLTEMNASAVAATVLMYQVLLVQSLWLLKQCLAAWENGFVWLILYKS